MPSSTSLLENEETEPELPPLVQTFAGMGIDDHLAQSQTEQPTLPHPCRTSPFSLLGAVLDLQPLPLNQAGTEEDDEEKSDEEALNENESVSHSLLAQAHVSGLGSVMLPGHEAQEPVVLYSDGLDDSSAQPVPGMIIPYGEPGYEPPLINMRRKSVNTKECVEVPSSEHVAEIVGRQGCKIKALRAKTNTYIKTPVRGEEPVFVVTGRKEDVAMAKREILSAAEHFSHIRASRNKAGPLTTAAPGLSGAPTLPGQTTIQVRVPYRVVGLVVGPKGATIKRIQQQTHTYIVTPSRDKEPVFEVTGMPENVDRAREEIEAHIALRTGSCVDMSTDDNDFHCNGTDVGFETAAHGAWLHSNTALPSGVHRGTGNGSARITASYRNDSSSSLGSGSSDSFYSGGGNRMADFSPTSPFNSNSSSSSGGGGGGGGGSFWFGESSMLPAGSEDLAGLDPPGFDSLPLATAAPLVNPVPMVWNPFEQGIHLFDARAPSFRDSQPGTPRLSPTFQEALEHPMAQFVQSGYLSSDAHKFPNYGPAFSSSSDSTTSNSPPDHQFCGPTSRGGGHYSLPRE
ncbi:RNA-binding E3 ubiquitin-protein ligase MEX3C [Alosa sapidissima]|uniref:RNA-binding E3 ubiquitin-protein ligase MEX3C n=1 Tax=Alosa sapidissima TaxID=34773 RepID=UPI001C08DF3C|nr:RNA-binding E3 ubiquitin-protein ligase MEX3C [Alosa sapidissima]